MCWPLVFDTILSVQVILVPNRLRSCDNDMWGDWVYGIDDKVTGVSGVGRERVLTQSSVGMIDRRCQETYVVRAGSSFRLHQGVLFTQGGELFDNLCHQKLPISHT